MDGRQLPDLASLPLLSSLDLTEEPSFDVLQITTLGWRVGEFHTEGLITGPQLYESILNYKISLTFGQGVLDFGTCDVVA